MVAVDHAIQINIFNPLAKMLAGKTKGLNVREFSLDPFQTPLIWEFMYPASNSCEPSQVLYMSSSFWLLGVESRDFSHAEKEETACKAEQIPPQKNYFLLKWS